MKAYLVDESGELTKKLKPVPVDLDHGECSDSMRDFFSFDIYPKQCLSARPSKPKNDKARTIHVNIGWVVEDGRKSRAFLFKSEKDHAEILESFS